jgi:tripartite ATP-independent transporter DctP family solute receptor
MVISMVSRRRLMRGAGWLAAGAAAAGPARAARFNLRCATNMPARHPLNLRLAEAFERIRQEAGGELVVQLLPNSQPGSDIDMLDQVRGGRLDMLAASPQLLGMLVPVAAISSIGFAFASYDQVWPAMDGALGTHIRGAITQAGLVVCGRIWDSGFCQITHQNKLIAKLVDLKNLRIRVANGPVALSLFRDLGSAPAPMSFVDLYRALETRIFDAQESPLAVIDAADIYKLHHFGSITNHMWDGFWIVANPTALSLLPQDMRAIVTRNLDQAALVQRADLRDQVDRLQPVLTDRGMTVNTPIMSEIRTGLSKSGFYTEWKRRMGPLAWSLLEQATGALT